MIINYSTVGKKMTSSFSPISFLVFLYGVIILSCSVHAQNAQPHRILWDSKTIEEELNDRLLRLDQIALGKLDEVKLYISKNNLKAASAVMTLLKARTTKRNDQIYYVDSYLDFRLGRFISSLRSLQKIITNDPTLQVKKCFLWLKIAWIQKMARGWKCF